MRRSLFSLALIFCATAAFGQASPQLQNLFWATPASGSGNLSLRTIVFGDLPSPFASLAVTGNGAFGTLGVTGAATVGGTFGVTGVETLSVPPVFSTLTGYCYANGAAPITCAAAIPLGTGVSGNLPIANQTSIAAASTIANATNAAAAPTAQPIPNFQPGGRLTLVSGAAVPLGSTAGATSVLYTPNTGDKIPLPVAAGAEYYVQTFAELSNVLANSSVGNAGPAAAGASSCYDLFVWSNAGVVTLTRGPAWTTCTLGTGARSAGSAIAKALGLYVNSVSITNGPAAGLGVWVGTIATNAAGTVDWIYGTEAANGGGAVFDVWNAYNQIQVETGVEDVTASWAYALAAIREAHGDTSFIVNFVNGGQGTATTNFFAEYTSNLALVSAVYPSVGLCFNVTNSLATGIGGGLAGYVGGAVGSAGAAGTIMQELGHLQGYPPIGQNTIAACETAGGTTSVTFYGAGNGMLSFRMRM